MKANTLTNFAIKSPFLVPYCRECLHQNLTKAGCCTSNFTSLNCVKHSTLSLYTFTLAEVTVSDVWKVGKVGRVGKVGKVGKVGREGLIKPTWNQL